MKIAVFISDNRPLDSNKETCQYNSCAAYINAIYCLAHKYSFFYLKPYAGDDNDVFICTDPNSGEKRHAAWAKLLSALIMCNVNKKEYDYIVYIDSDCVFKNIHKRLESLIESYPEKDILIANNKPYHPHLPCSAFMICKNNDWMRRFLRNWFTCAHPTSDSLEWNNVLRVASTTYDTPKFTIGTYWEQDILWVLYQNPEIASHIQLLTESIMFEDSSDQFLIHISKERNNLRKPYFMNYVEHLEAQTKQSFDAILSIIPVYTYNTSDLTFDSCAQ